MNQEIYCQVEIIELSPKTIIVIEFIEQRIKKEVVRILRKNNAQA